MTTQYKEMYNGKELTYDANSSRGMIILIYHDVDGQLYMPLNERFVKLSLLSRTIKEIPCSEGFS